MKNKCKKCGYEYGEFDIYCARCGNKIVTDDSEIQKASRRLVFETIKKSKNDSKENSQNEDDKKSIYDNMIFNFVICLIIVSSILITVLYFALDSHTMAKAELQYKNLMNNPQQIPLLDEPSNIDDLVEKLDNVEKFLNMYLKYSKDDIDKKEQIFISYLNEMEKLPHITNDNIIKDDSDICSKNALKCAKKIELKVSNVGIKAFYSANTVFLYPDYRFIKDNYSKYLSKQMRDYIALKSKYNMPVSIDLNLYIKPKKLADKIADFEEFYLKSDDLYIKEELENIIYNDFRKFIFTPSIYDTTTQEMTNDFKNAYNYFIKTKKNSSLRPVVMSYMDKKRSYNEENFKNDYPYKLCTKTFEENIQNSILSDVFVQLRKNIFSKNSNSLFTHVYNVQKGSWKKYSSDVQIMQGEYIISETDENNNVSIYSNSLSLIQELNISKYGKIYLINGSLYVYNSDKLSLSKIIFNGRNFSIKTLSSSEVTSVFPGVEVINIDSYSNYNIKLYKDTYKANYIVLSRYSQGYNQYVLSATKGSVDYLILPNMFSVNNQSEAIVSFHYKDTNPDETSDSSPTYKFSIRTKISDNDAYEEDYPEYDEKTANDEKDSYYKPNIMPKITNEEDTDIEEDIPSIPNHNIDPPKDSD